MKVLYKSLLFSSLFLAAKVGAQNSFWSNASESSMKNASQKRLVTPSKFRSLSLDTAQLKQFLKTAPKEYSAAANSNPVIMEIPMPDGSVSHFSIVESSMMEPGLAAKFPNFKTYSGQGIEDKTATIRMDWTDLGFHAMIYSAVSPVISVDPYALGNKTGYISYSKVDLPERSFVEKGVEELVSQQTNQLRTQAGSYGNQLKTYRLAVAAQAEYTIFFGGTVSAGLSAIVTTVNRINGVYEKELAVRLVLVSNNNLIVYTDPATDPYTTTDVNGTMLNQNQTAIDGAIGSANYDVGHVVSTIDGGGLAQRPAVCIAGSKARGATGLANPSGDAYDIDFVAHELGHQFGGSHTFNAGTGSCAGSTRNASTAVEPGSGVTIMAYAGICGATNNIAAHSIPYFHTISQVEIYTNLTSGLSSGCSASVTTSNGNSVPSVNAGADYTIPAGTPFILTGSATDANTEDVLTYSWEEIDPGLFAANWNSGSTPFFRSFAPSLTPTRYFPQLSDVAGGTVTIGEVLPSTAQVLNFRLTARDNRNTGGGVAYDEMTVTLVSGAAFNLSSQTSATSWTANGTNTATITWNVAGTNAAPFNTANVAILFSADGGLTFPYTLIASTANDGTENIVIPSVATTKGRIMIKAIGNVFFNVNTANITVTTSSCVAEGAVISPVSMVSAPAGNAALNLSLTPQYATAFTASGTISSTDPQSTLAVLNSSSTGCQQYSNPFSYDAYPFVVSVTGSYTFNRTGSGTIFNIYSNSYDPSNPCTNFVTSNYTDNVGIYASKAVTLTAGVPYVLVEGVYWQSGAPAVTLPFAYSFTVTPPAGGGVFSGSGVYANPGSGYSYSYVIVNNATNVVKAIASSPNLTASATYPNGTSYSVYGISYTTSQAAALNAYVGGSFSALTSGILANSSTLCANLSKNAVSVVVTAPVPVSFLGLKARKQDKKVQLEWSTASEQNSDYFELQRSADGSSFTTSLGKLAAAGNSNAVKNYALTDGQPLSGWVYYRVKQVDKDGKTAYSNVAAINFEKGGQVVIIYPNPTKDKLTIEYTATKAGNVQLKVLDSKGSTVLNSNTAVTVGRNTSSLNVAALNSGVYILRTLDADGNINHIKFIKE